ncbi:gastrula zinc finger protein XlCGF7.1-like [Adelges cooleyi]|uniref:gastrula zinc finger protein XlCGF7.1-like n=1 Tax=Adelges cooleyi TaxID=133065 RepID=UPI00218087AF|nr:gastrula zinc finger protein XlCGF7.1-like [Adelges cooleyi]
MTSTFRSSDILQQMDFAMLGTHFASGPILDQDFGSMGNGHFISNGAHFQSDSSDLGSQLGGLPSSWQSIATPGSTVADYLSHLPATLTLHHFLKYSGENSKEKEDLKPKKRKKSEKQTGTTKKYSQAPTQQQQYKQKPGQIRITKCADGTTTFGCPECQAEYLDKHLLEEHLGSHATERRFVCDICGAGLKRKDHLTRHRQSHSSERPYACTICGKAFKRKEQLTLHRVVHTGEKRHACLECGRAFYRKDHLRKHARSHATRRDKSGQTSL